MTCSRSIAGLWLMQSRTSYLMESVMVTQSQAVFYSFIYEFIQLIFIEHFYRPSTVSCMRAGQQIRSKKAHLAARLTGEQKKSEGSEKTGSSMTKLGLPIRTSDSRPRTLSFYQKSVSQGQEIFTL